MAPQPALSASQETTEVTETSREEAEDAEDAEVVSQTEVETTRVDTGEGEEGREDRRERAGRAVGDSVARERTVVTEKRVDDEGLDDEVVGIIMHFGLVSVGDLEGDENARAVGGFSVDGNLLADVPTSPGKPFLGPSIGIFYSHLGQPGGNFFGLDSPGDDDEGAHLVLIPLNVKGGYTFNESVRLSAHIGANLAYQSEAEEFENDEWQTATNLGFDVEFGLGDDTILLIRPDWTIRDGANVFTGTLGLGFPIS